jgi:hypothetical protein
MRATITDAKDFPSTVWVEIERDGKTELHQLHLEDYDCLEVVEYWSGNGYAMYADAEDKFPDIRFYVDTYFTREGQDFIPEEPCSDQVEIEELRPVKQPTTV